MLEKQKASGNTLLEQPFRERSRRVAPQFPQPTRMSFVPWAESTMETKVSCLERVTNLIFSELVFWITRSI